MKRMPKNMGIVPEILEKRGKEWYHIDYEELLSAF